MHATEEQIIDAMLGDAEAEVTAHVAECAECQAEVGTFRRVFELVYDVPEVPEGYLDDAWARLRSRLEPRPAPIWKRARFLATAATMMIAVIAGLLAFVKERPPLRNPVATTPHLVAPYSGPRPYLWTEVTAPALPVEPKDIVEQAEIARSDQPLRKRLDAILALGMFGSQAGETLVSLYGSQQDPKVRHAIVKALARQQNASAIEQLAQRESDPAVKKFLTATADAVRAHKAGQYYAHERRQ